jgi:hypothetical protein
MSQAGWYEWKKNWHCDDGSNHGLLAPHSGFGANPSSCGLNCQMVSISSKVMRQVIIPKKDSAAPCFTIISSLNPYLE